MQKSRLERKGQLAFLLLGATTVLLSAVTAWTVVRFHTDAGLVEHSREMLATLSAFQASVSQAESSIRAFFVNGDDSFLADFREKSATAAKVAAHLREL